MAKIMTADHAKCWQGFRAIGTCMPCCCLVAKLCQTLCDPMDYGFPGSSVHGIS